MGPKPITLRLSKPLLEYLSAYAGARKLSLPAAIAALIHESREHSTLEAIRTPQFIAQLRANGFTWPEIANRLGEPKTTIQSRLQTAIARGEVK